MTFTLTPRKPRNPIVAPAHFRRAGSHQAGACGQQAAATRKAHSACSRIAIRFDSRMTQSSA